LIQAVPEVYGNIDALDPDLANAVQIKTHYEQLFVEKGHQIHYLSFKLN